MPDPRYERVDPGFVIDRPVVVFPTGSASQIVFDNPLGNLHVREGGGDTVEVSLFVQRWSGDRSGARIRRANRDGRWYVTVEAADAPDGSRALRADAVVMVPSRIGLRLYTDFGTIDARRLTNPSIEARSDSGDIQVVATSTVNARSESGRIRATLMTRDWPGPQRLASGSGDIHVFVPRGPDLAIHARTGGALSTGWGAQVDSDGAGHELYSVQGSGARSLSVVSGSGRVEIHELIADRTVPAGR